MVFGNGKQLAYQESVDSLFQSVSNGKALVADAITDKGVSTSATATFETMATNIRNIIARFAQLSNQASASQILSGRSAYNYAGTRINGTYACPTPTITWYSTTVRTQGNGVEVTATLNVSNPTNFIAYVNTSSTIANNLGAEIKINNLYIRIYEMYGDGLRTYTSNSPTALRIIGNILTTAGHYQSYNSFPTSTSIRFYYTE